MSQNCVIGRGMCDKSCQGWRNRWPASHHVTYRGPRRLTGQRDVTMQQGHHPRIIILKMVAARQGDIGHVVLGQ